MSKENKKSVLNLKHRLPIIKTLAMLKMEKNFIALEKGYDRQPYRNNQATLRRFLQRIREETDEFERAIANWDMDNCAEELADISNIVDYAFEAVTSKRMQFSFDERRETSQ